MAFLMGMDFHEGEEKMHQLLKNPRDMVNPTAPTLTPQAANMLQRAPLLALGTLDLNDRPWTTLWGGDKPLAEILGRSMIAIKSKVDKKYDPVVQALYGESLDGISEDVLNERLRNKMLSGLTIDLNTRKRVKLYGQLAAGTIRGDEAVAEFILRVDQSLGNCPKYLNAKTITAATVAAELVSTGPKLTEEAVAVVNRSDLFFVSSSHSNQDMDTNHRGGPLGFVRVNQAADATEIFWPEYSGNRLYQTLGNLMSTPRAGLVFPDFETGDVVYVTGTTEILIGADADAQIPRSNLAVKLTVTDSRFVRQGLPYRGQPGEPSPYNPKVRPLASEANIAIPGGTKSRTLKSATLVGKEDLTPTISRFRFSLDDAGAEGQWKPGQWVALDFATELDIGYSHMRDDDPLSINDDFIRTFTVSNHPSSSSVGEFEITIRKVGPVTKFLGQQHGRSGTEVGVKGFGGELQVTQEGVSDGGNVVFVAGGVGITPLLGCLPDLSPEKLQVLWSLRGADIGLLEDTIKRHKQFAQSLHVYITGSFAESARAKLEELKQQGVTVHMKRMDESQIKAAGENARRWYICTQPAFREVLMEWLKGQDVLFEDFSF